MAFLYPAYITRNMFPWLGLKKFDGHVNKKFCSIQACSSLTEKILTRNLVWGNCCKYLLDKYWFYSSIKINHKFVLESAARKRYKPT